MKVPRIRTVAGAIKRVAVAKARGQAVLLDAGTVKQRLDACAKCPFLDKKARQCLECRCFVDLKAQLSTETCPKHRWTITNQ